jgi:hypothetical protein
MLAPELKDGFGWRGLGQMVCIFLGLIIIDGRLLAKLTLRLHNHQPEG